MFNPLGLILTVLGRLLGLMAPPYQPPSSPAPADANVVPLRHAPEQPPHGMA